MSRDSRVLICNSPYAQGGIGQHFAQLVEQTRAEGLLHSYIASGLRDGDDRGRLLANRTYGLLQYTPIRWFPGAKSYTANVFYDLRASRLLPRATRLMGFVGKSLYSFRRARSLDYEVLELVAANSHVDNVARLHRRAAQATGINDTWLNRAQIRQTRREYELADVIYVHSQYVYQSFVDAGIPETKLRRMILRLRDRFQPPDRRALGDEFHLTYVGRLDATKGLPILMEAFKQLPVPKKRLTLVGGWSSPMMRRYLQSKIQADPRITLAAGDPLPVLHNADVFVHPSFEDGYAYAPAEALACGVPVIVTEDTGMKEYVEAGRNGFVIPTGSTEDLVEALTACHQAPLATTQSLFHSSVPSLSADIERSEPST
jgi:glycosyltransferase involved in cell wall biosynthesis